jgi:DNA-binding XRE family transcriptional regulator
MIAKPQKNTLVSYSFCFAMPLPAIFLNGKIYTLSLTPLASFYVSRYIWPIINRKGINMSPQHRVQDSLPPEVATIISQLGERIRIARKRRAITMEDMASRMFVTRKTLARLENGNPGVSLAVFASALWVLGLEKDLHEIAVPEHDKVGIYRERQRLPERVRSSGSKDDLDF